MPTQDRPDVEVWRYSYGDKPHTVAAYERPDREGEVWLRWSNPAKPGRDKREYRNLNLKVRSAARASLDFAQTQLAERAVHEQHARLLREHQQLALPLRVEPEPRQISARRLTLVTEANALTLRAGFDLALKEKDGKYFSTDSRRYRDMVAMSKRLFGDDGMTQLIDPEMSWDDFGVAEIRALRRGMAMRYLASSGKEFGMRKAEVFVDAIYTVAAFLREQGVISSTTALPVGN